MLGRCSSFMSRVRAIFTSLDIEKWWCWFAGGKGMKHVAWSLQQEAQKDWYHEP
jgi:hypothetical protein